MCKKVLVGMSGGVDSSVSAAILKEQGYEVIGVTLRLRDDSHSLKKDIEDAKKVADVLGIEYHVLDYKEDFKKYVIDYFVNEYKQGRTPNPCIMCNEKIKFGVMLKWAKDHGIDYVATGHYGFVEHDKEKDRYILKQADSKKDQSYFLCRLTQDQLKRIIFPLSRFKSKEEIRQLAEKYNLPVASKGDSEEICFIPDGDYASFIESYTGEKFQQGNFVDTNGKVLGKHKGIIYYTIGQRKGLGVTFGKPMYVVKIDYEKNEVVLGEEGQQYAKGMIVDHLNLVSATEIPQHGAGYIKVRFMAPPQKAEVECIGDGLVKIIFDKPQRAITPGQWAVCYENNEVQWGATIKEVIS